MTKTDRTADLKLIEPAARSGECLPSAAGEISALASANAPFVYFDGVPFYSVDHGVGGVTLAAARQIRNVPGHGVASDHAIVAHIRGSLKSLMNLRDTLNELERKAAEQAEAALAAAAEAESPPGRPH